MSEDKELLGGYSVEGSMDGFIRPPPPRGLPNNGGHLPRPLPQTLPTVVHPPAPAPPRQAPPVPIGDHLVESLLALAQLLDANIQLTRQLFNAPEQTQWRIQVIMFMWMRQLSPPATIPAPVAANGATGHVYSTVLRTRVRQKIREILMRSTLESYSRAQSVDGHLYVHSPLPLVKSFILEQSPVFRRTYLPPGLPNNHESMTSLVTFLRAMLKHERTHMRNVLLSNIRQDARPQEHGTCAQTIRPYRSSGLSVPAQERSAIGR
ncbi:hypothetical protein PtA15_1A852 [Puccinia triticina]|uniref:Uncharacterized protein n=1 Tax=Puccinia triticina TaxID=208348 RepID=A0ABY7C9P1_9BASI|nr:uncharacterized protein PtA15_1A852 [Puccinia triticina]WAQ81510.1 hypothetical protein PtA15_1A852 [Puccinia triticina]